MKISKTKKYAVAVIVSGGDIDKDCNGLSLSYIEAASEEEALGKALFTFKTEKNKVNGWNILALA